MSSGQRTPRAERRDAKTVAKTQEANGKAPEMKVTPVASGTDGAFGRALLLAYLALLCASCHATPTGGKTGGERLSGVPFYQIRDSGKVLVAQRIQQQPAESANLQEQQTQADNNGESPRQQQQSLMSSLDQMLGDLASTTAMSALLPNTVTTTTQRPTDAPTDNQPMTSRAGDVQQLDQQRDFSDAPATTTMTSRTTKSTSSMLSTPNSISMSLDGMLVNSGPRGEQQQQQAGGSRLTSRVGDSPAPSSPNAMSLGGDNQRFSSTNQFKARANSSNLISDANGQPAAKLASNRVPFSGTPFSSPAAKGQRTKPKASNQSVGQPLDSPVTSLASASRNQKGGGRRTNGQQQQVFGLPQQQQQQQQQPFVDSSATMLGFGETPFDRQFNQQQVANAAPIDESGAPSGDNFLSNKMSIQQQLAANDNDFANQIRPANRQIVNDDMVMSVISSADGKERRLVMMARDTLEALRKYAASTAATKQQQASGLKGPQQTVAEQRARDSSLVTGVANNWWPTSNQQQQRPTQTTTAMPPLQSLGNAEQQVELRPTTTTTVSPLMMDAFGAGNSIPMSQGSGLAQSNSSDGFSQQSDLSSTSRSPLSVVSISDTFREVSVPSSEPSDLPTTTTTSTTTTARPRASGTEQQASGRKTAKGNNKSELSGGSGTRKGGSKSGKSKSSGSGGSGTDSPKSNAQSKQMGGKTKTNGAKKSQQPSGSTRSPAQTNLANKRLDDSAGNLMDANIKSSGKSTSSAGREFAKRPPAVAAGGNGDSLGVSSSPMTSSGEPTQATSGESQSPRNNGNNPSRQLKSTKFSGQQPADRVSGRESQTSGPAAVQSSATADEGSSGAQTGGISTGEDKTTQTQPQPTPSAPANSLADELERARPMTGAPSSSPGGRGGGPSDDEQPLSSANSLEGLRNSIPGEPQLDYPTYASPPETSFSCTQQSCPGGYYADTEAQCQVFHICQSDGRFDTFLCPNGTIFSQQHFVCVWWWQADCKQSASFYKINDGIYCNAAQAPGDFFAAPATTSPPSATSGDSVPPSGELQPSRAAVAADQSQSSSAAGSPSESPISSSTAAVDGSATTIATEAASGSSTEAPQQAQTQQASGRQPTSGGGQQIDDSFGEAELNQQQQHQLELLARRA